MCLIAYVKPGNVIPENYFRAAAHDNNDGIGVMSLNGVDKFLGRKMVKRAWRRVRRLQDAQQEFAVHFRFATHGRVALANTHPFRTPDGNAYVMHNGILSDYTPKDRDGDMSDTRALVNVMIGVDVVGDPDYWKALEDHIGWSNKLCVMSPDGQFRIVNEDAGDWIDGVWYSQTYSLPGVKSSYWWDRYETAQSASTYYSGGYQGPSYYLDSSSKYHEVGDTQTTGSNMIARPYEVRSVAAALERQNAAYANGAGNHSLPSGTYLPAYDRSTRDDAALDAELDRHFADMAAADDGEPTDICPACESLHSEGRQCPECGYVDMSDGMLDAYQVGAK